MNKRKILIYFCSENWERDKLIRGVSCQAELVTVSVRGLSDDVRKLNEVAT